MDILCSDDITRTVAEAHVAALEAYATAAGLAPVDLDDLVHDCCDASASRRVNNDSDLPEDIEAAQDAAYADASTIGSRVNNEGIRGQVAFLIAELGYLDAKAALERATAAKAT